jgi:hypothetical protein
MSAAPLRPTAEHILDVGIRRAISLIREGHTEAAERALALAGLTAVLVEMDGK